LSFFKSYNSFYLHNIFVDQYFHLLHHFSTSVSTTTRRIFEDVFLTFNVENDEKTTRRLLGRARPHQNRRILINKINILQDNNNNNSNNNLSTSWNIFQEYNNIIIINNNNNNALSKNFQEDITNKNKHKYIFFEHLDVSQYQLFSQQQQHLNKLFFKNTKSLHYQTPATLLV